ncbi:putative golgi transport complex component cog5 protein [Botrytis fragariae]|uniref:Conserved oligomeric Golgi complex subunit 5 n=1 Tax=Botrytis fragariae TaxID=1964551 RepID=A0A8H6ELA6_9HELO|nr:putative golgi transport complex component cog5 protein [Botrytis fragariae]KAF5876436.1 putative golgi transport complex component cog5 protein [Botrytis fragariae]
MTSADEENSYIDYETFLSPTFSPSSFANSLVLGTNNPTDTPLDLSTPLSRVLFDAQEINTHIDTLTTKSALPLLSHTQDQTESSQRIVQEIDSQVASLNDGYKRLEKEVLVRYETAEEVQTVASRLWETVRLGRVVARCLQLGRQLEIQLSEIGNTGAPVKVPGAKEDHKALVRCSNTLLNIRELFQKSGPGEEGHGLERIEVVRTLQTSIINPAERVVLSRSQQLIREFSMSNLSSSSNTSTYAQTRDTKERTDSALKTLYLLSSTSGLNSKNAKKLKWEPDLLVQSLQDYLRTALTSSLASLSRALATLPTLDRTLLEVSARCQNVLALESLLASIQPPAHPNLPSDDMAPVNFLLPLLTSLETGSLPSYFWRTLAGGLTTKVQEIINKGGVSARTLRSNRNSVRDAIRECVVKGSRAPAGITALKGEKKADASWEREVAVMVGSVMGPLGR